MATISSLVGRNTVLIGLALGVPAALVGGCSSRGQAPAGAGTPEVAATTDGIRGCGYGTFLCDCGAGCSPEYQCFPKGLRGQMACENFCSNADCSPPPPPPPPPPPACVQESPPPCPDDAGPSPQDDAGTCNFSAGATCDPRNTWQGYTWGDAGAQAGFHHCPGGACPTNFSLFEDQLASLGCLPGGTPPPPTSDPGKGTRSIVCFTPPPGYPDPSRFGCGYGNDWYYALCPNTQAVLDAAQAFDSTACRPVFPETQNCLDVNGGVTGIVVFYDPQCHTCGPGPF